MKYPDIYQSDFSDIEVAKDAIEYAIDKFRRKRQNNERINKLYESYNGIVDNSVYKFITDTYGKSSRTKYIDYKLGRSKVKRLTGEYLSANLSATVKTTNREAVNKKLEKYKELIGMAEAKPYIETVREATNMNVFPGVKFPQKDSPEFQKMKNLKLLNERAMQHIINSKIIKQNLKLKFKDNLKDVIISAECFGKVERDINGVDTYRKIEPKFSMYEEQMGDTLLRKSPYLGEYRPMFQHQVLSTFKLDKKQKEYLSDLMDSNSSERIDSGGYVTYDKTTDSMLIDTYTIEMIGVKAVRIKYSDGKHGKKYTSILSDEYYNSNKETIKRDLKKKKYKIETRYKETLYTITRIGKDIWCNHEEVKDQIQTRMGGRKFKVDSNYTGLLFDTTDGIRISLFEMTVDLNHVYNFIRHAVNRELGKIKGKVVTYDEAYLPDGESISDILYKMTEDALISYNSAEASTDDPNIDPRQTSFGDKIKEIDLGASGSLGLLIQAGQDIERVMDRLTGLNDARQGTNPASKTATGIQSDMQASQAMTYDMFYEFQKYTDLVLTKLAEKTKINYNYLHEDVGALELSDEEYAFIKATKDLSMDDYSAETSDGRKELEVIERIRSLYEPQINSRELRVQDVAKAEMQDTYAGYIEVLENAWSAIAQNAMEKEEKAQQAENERHQKTLEAQEKQIQGERQFQLQKDSQNNQADIAQISEQGKLKKEIEMIQQAYQRKIVSEQAALDMLHMLAEKKEDLKIAIAKEKAKPKPVSSGGGSKK